VSSIRRPSGSHNFADQRVLSKTSLPRNLARLNDIGSPGRWPAPSMVRRADNISPPDYPARRAIWGSLRLHHARNHFTTPTFVRRGDVVAVMKPRRIGFWLRPGKAGYHAYATAHDNRAPGFPLTSATS